ncbi:dihydrolipoyl dehydrogenase family protein [Halobacillus seohaensis]|uniref:Dihydrolipoyl dehydrogenase family protein n=1 Tax=Halobacillus seohaensis TaxID=447421 RepID=A0ABW2EQL5_9BACI
MNYDYQLAVIGGGAGGLTVAAGAASFGSSVALIEQQSEVGGDCLHYGCIPSKALIQAAGEVNVTAQQAGLTEEQYNYIFKNAMKCVSEAIDDIQSHDSKQRFIDMGIDIYQHTARFEDEHTLQVGQEFITAKRIVIATGSSPTLPSIDGLDTVPYLTNESIFNLKERPSSLVVIGGGIVGVELSQAMAHLGVKVTILEKSDHILSNEDTEIAKMAQNILSEDLTVMTRTQVNQVELAGNQVCVHFTEGNHKGTIEASQLLVATGRRANIKSLQLGNAGVDTKEGTIQVDHHLRTNKKHIYAVGDCNGSMPFTHVAGMEGKTVVSNAVFGLPSKVSYEQVPWVIYTSPEIYHLGLTELEAKAKYGHELLTFKTLLEDSDRFIAERNTSGIVKVMTKSNGKIVGAHAFGVGAGEWMQEVGTLQSLNKKFQTLSNVIHPYPARNNVLSQTADLYWRDKLFNSKWNHAIRWYVRKFR